MVFNVRDNSLKKLCLIEKRNKFKLLPCAVGNSSSSLQFQYAVLTCIHSLFHALVRVSLCVSEAGSHVARMAFEILILYVPQVPTRPLLCAIISSFLPFISLFSSPSSSSSLSSFSRESLTVLSRLDSILKFSYLFLPCARIMELCHHTWLNFGNVMCQRMFCLFVCWTLEPVLRMELSRVWIHLFKARGTGCCN